MSLNINKLSNEVFIAVDEIVKFDAEAISFLKERAKESSIGRSRICAHKKTDDLLHEMLIAISSDSYIRPHRHANKAESFHLIEGNADIVVFFDDGSINEIIKLGKEDNFYYRLDSPYYHTLLINSPYLIIHEITNGPFDNSESDFAGFSPFEGSKEAKKYIDELRLLVKDHKEN